MKKLLALTSAITALLTPISAFAADATIDIIAPELGYKNLGAFVTNLITISFSIAVLAVLIMLIWGSFEWITSGGDKEAVGNARNRIINALIGIAVLSIAFALATVGAQILGFPDITTEGLPIPAPPTT
ncbi:hypothetical protein KKE78_04820 [Patescibacteria group bacterium]|nr:hypothetical protein [Patescibacteria group bacterium]